VSENPYLQQPPLADNDTPSSRWMIEVWKKLGRAGALLGSLRFGSETNYSQFEEDGTLVANGDATTWCDVYPSSVTVAVGGTAPSFTSYNGGSLGAYEFTGAVSNKEMQIGYQLYHSYLEGSNITPHIHLAFTSGASDAGKTIIFDCEYEWNNVSATGAYSTVILTGTYTIGANNTVYRNEKFNFTGTGSGTGHNTPITGTGKTISSIFMTKLTRRQDLDTFASSVWLLSADIHIEQNTIGSRKIATKA
jgi:hypothetical protein